MSRESMKDIIENSIKSAGLSETEVAEWVSNLKAFHDEETKRRKEREDDFFVHLNAYTIIANDLRSTREQLDTRVRALGQLEVQMAQERDELNKLKHEFVRERVLLTDAISKLKPERSMQFFVAFLAAALTLLGWLGVQVLAPVVARRVNLLLALF